MRQLGHTWGHNETSHPCKQPARPPLLAKCGHAHNHCFPPTHSEQVEERHGKCSIGARQLQAGRCVHHQHACMPLWRSVHPFLQASACVPPRKNNAARFACTRSPRPPAPQPGCHLLPSVAAACCHLLPSIATACCHLLPSVAVACFLLTHVDVAEGGEEDEEQVPAELALPSLEAQHAVGGRAEGRRLAILRRAGWSDGDLQLDMQLAAGVPQQCCVTAVLRHSARHARARVPHDRQACPSLRCQPSDSKKVGTGTHSQKSREKRVALTRLKGSSTRNSARAYGSAPYMPAACSR